MRHWQRSIDDVFELILALGYRGYSLVRGRPTPLASFDVERDQLRYVHELPSSDYVNNFLFIPADDSWQPDDS